MLKSADDRTVLYLIRHGATEANLARPARIQGRAHNPPLARLGVRQAEATRDFLAIRPIDQCYTSPLLRRCRRRRSWPRRTAWRRSRWKS